MNLQNKVKDGIRCCVFGDCHACPYDKNEFGEVVDCDICKPMLVDDFELLISDMENTIKLLEAET